MGGPAQQPDNDFTRMIRQTAEVNRGGGVGRVEGPVTAGPQPNVRSAAYGIQPEVPLTVEERMELDALAAAAGVQVNASEEEAGYPSRAEAEALGAPINQPREPLTALADEVPQPLMGRQSTREFRTPSFPKLPDFSKPGVLDLIRGVIYLDGLEFPIPEADLAEFRAYVVTAVAADIQLRLNAALAQYVPKETADGGDAKHEDVQQVQEDKGPRSVQSSDEPA